MGCFPGGPQSGGRGPQAAAVDRDLGWLTEGLPGAVGERLCPSTVKPLKQAPRGRRLPVFFTSVPSEDAFQKATRAEAASPLLRGGECGGSRGSQPASGRGGLRGQAPGCGAGSSGLFGKPAVNPAPENWQGFAPVASGGPAGRSGEGSSSALRSARIGGRFPPVPAQVVYYHRPTPADLPSL